MTTLPKCLLFLISFFLLSILDVANGDTLITQSGSTHQGHLVEIGDEIVRFKTDGGTIIKFRKDTLKELQTADGVLNFAEDGGEQAKQLEDKEQTGEENKAEGPTGKRRCYCRTCDDYYIVSVAVKAHEQAGHDVDIPEDLQNLAKMVRASIEQGEKSDQERSEWWNSLSEEEQQDWLQRKEERAREKEERLINEEERLKREEEWERQEESEERWREQRREDLEARKELEEERDLRRRQREIERYNRYHRRKDRVRIRTRTRKRTP